MKLTREAALEAAKKDLSKRLHIDASKIDAQVSDRDFPDMSLGAPARGEMAAQMISSGWQIDLTAAGKKFDYRADKYQLRLANFDGTNHVIKT